MARSGLVADRATRFWLKAYGGRTRSLLSPRAFAAGPQVVSGVVAWVTPTGQLLSAVDDRFAAPHMAGGQWHFAAATPPAC